MKKLAIFGSGVMASHIAYYARQRDYTITGFFNDLEPKGKLIDGLPVLGGREEVQPAYERKQFDELVLAIGYRHFDLRKTLFEELAGRVAFARIVHSDVYVADSSRIGQGAVILSGCILDDNVLIGDNVFLNIGCAIAHHTTIGNHSFLSPRVAVAGFSHIGECCNLGTNATIIDNINIADNVQVGAGTVVIKDLAEAGVYVGNPARRIR